VQADLLVVAFELRACLEGADPATRERLAKAIAEIERIRSTEVRSASRRLSPAFGSVGLDTALADLAESWESAMSVRVTFDEKARPLLMGGGASRDLLTAIYRVTEQALLNAASHGHASSVTISISLTTDAWIVLVVEDDGRGLPRTDVVRGSGTAIMDAWCAFVFGSWRWQTSMRGVRLEAQFPI
jgi:two-component system sensor histidine kinase UhpB